MEKFTLLTLALVGVVCFYAFPVAGHGRLLDPPSRASAWRQGFPTPADYQDNQLFCGGLEHQKQQGYKCGVCGDPYDGPWPHQVGGKYATGTIVRTYRRGQTIDVNVDLTANHKGYFQIKICKYTRDDQEVSQGCLDQNVLQLASGSGTRYPIAAKMRGQIKYRVRLPRGLTCNHCLLQWHYHTANSWGVDPDGTSGIGKGEQEEFYGCADVRIR